MATIAVVDDDRDIREIISNYMRVSGHDVVTAADGHEALEVVRTHEPDLLVLDWMMPRLTGPEVCRALRADDRYAHLPVLIVTARTVGDELDEAVASGASCLLRKPFSLAQLGSCMDELIAC